jgi:ferredoxin--NADP+ reductase
MGFQALLVCVGAQGTKWLGLPGEQLPGVYHAKEAVYHYNRLPPYSRQPFPIGRRVAVVGAGNVMLDLTHWLAEKMRVDEVIAVARRGPGEVKFDRKELESVAAYLNMKAVGAELGRVAPVMLPLGENPDQFRELILTARDKAAPPVSDTRFSLLFLASPRRILSDDSGHVTGLELEENTLALEGGEVKAKGLGTRRVLAVDTIIFAIGDRVDEQFGLPVEGNEFVKNANPRFPVDGRSYEVESPDACCPIEDVFVAGWSRKASTGLVGVARKDGINGARAVLQYLATLPAPATTSLEKLQVRLRRLQHPAVTNADLLRLEAAEREIAEREGEPGFKFASNEDMLAAMGLGQQEVALD